ncbi:MAG: hypothetical protein CL833_05885, partial [Crocinitomicaceae bacterium]|nr:hypothetical protein [Crocinitomicaceae bacterium]
PSGSFSQTINFPEEHNLKPMISTTIEGENEIIPYAISGVNTTDYTILFSRNTTEDYTLHTISTEQDIQRIS